jgi:IS5 family transposase
LIRFTLTGGERHDMTEAENLLHGLKPKYVVADKGYDSNALRQQIRRQKAKPVIPARKNTRRRRYDKTKYKIRNSRAVLQPRETLPTRRHTLRQDRHQLHRIRLPRCYRLHYPVNVNAT